MNDERVRPLTKTLSSLASNLWWYIVMDKQIWMKNHLVIDNICNVVNLQLPQKITQGMTNNVGLTFSGGEPTWYRGLQLVLSKRIEIGDTKYHI